MLHVSKMSRTDASKFVPVAVSARTTQYLQPKYLSSVNKLSDFDKKRFCFLLYNALGTQREKQERIYRLLRGREPLTVMNNIIHEMDATDKDSLIQEILFTMKKYYFLRVETNMCYHKAELYFRNINNCRISQSWKDLFKYCEQMIDEDVRKLSEIFSDALNNEFADSAECLILTLIQKHIITENDNSKLQHVIATRLPDLFSAIDDSVYHMVHLPHGKAVIINQMIFEKNLENELEDRNGSDKDEGTLAKLWDDFGFQVYCYKNLTKSEAIQVLKDLAKEDHSKFDALIICILSHGVKDGFYCTDGNVIEYDELANLFGEEAKTLLNKPKLFFIQACRGPEPQTPLRLCENVKKSLFKADGSGTEVTGRRKDMFWFMSTVKGYASFRNEDTGSVFIQNLEEVIRKDYKNHHLADIATIVNKKITSQIIQNQSGDNHVQVPDYSSTLCKSFMFHKQGTAGL